MTTYRELRADDLLTMLIPQQPLYPLSKIHVPVFLQPQPGQNVAVFIVRWAVWRLEIQLKFESENCHDERISVLNAKRR